MPDAFCTIIWENKSQDKSCVIIWSFFRDPSKLPNYVLLRQGQPCQSTRQCLPVPSKTVHSRFNGSQKFALQQSDNVARTNKVCCSRDSIMRVISTSVLLLLGFFFLKRDKMPRRKIWLKLHYSRPAYMSLKRKLGSLLWNTCHALHANNTNCNFMPRAYRTKCRKVHKMKICFFLNCSVMIWVSSNSLVRWYFSILGHISGWFREHWIYTLLSTDT